MQFTGGASAGRLRKSECWLVVEGLVIWVRSITNKQKSDVGGRRLGAYSF